jgi:uncharacterized protein YprB with RNaseH-like and TPR domain
VFHSESIIFADIETTGFECDKKVIAFALEELNGNGFSVSNKWPDDDARILDMFADKIDEYRRDKYQICTYNGENWKGGFDIPFLRTQFLINDIHWAFAGMRHLDLYPLIDKRFNMKFKTATMARIAPGAKLDHVYSVLGGPELGFEDLDGSKIPGLYEKWLETKDNALLKKLEGYNLSDVQQLKYVYKRVLPYLPEYEVLKGWVPL